MWLKLFTILLLVTAVWCESVRNKRGLGKGRALRSYVEEAVPSPLYEVPCMERGGLCLPKNQCPEGKHVGINGLCPLQQDQGIECCYSVSKSSTCRGNGGECMAAHTRCPPNLTFKASDCDDDEKCCILIN